MNVTSYVQQRQYGRTRSRRSSQRKIECFLETKLTQSFVNKACEISGRCRSTFVMQFSSDGTKVASTHGDHSVRVTEISSGKCLHTLRGHPRTPWSLAYHPSYCNILASGCLGGQVRIWDLYGHGCEVWNTENEAVVASLTFHPTDQVLVIAAGNTLYFWDWTKPEPFAKCSTSHEYERIRWIHFDSLGHTLYTGISNNTSVHRDELSSVSHTGDEVRQSSSQPSRLSSVYNNIVGHYQDYRREILLSRFGPVGLTGTASSRQLGSSGVVGVGHMGPTGTNPASGVSARTGMTESVGIGELLPPAMATTGDHSASGTRPGYDIYSNPYNGDLVTLASSNSRSRSLLGVPHVSRRTDTRVIPERMRHRGRWRSYDYSRHNVLSSVGNLQPSRQSIFGSLSATEREHLLNPRHDPLLSSATETNSSNLEIQPAGEAIDNDASDRPVITSVRRVVNESSLGDHYLPAIDVTEEIEIPLEAVTGQYIRPQPSGSQETSEDTDTSNSVDTKSAIKCEMKRSGLTSAIDNSSTSHQTDSAEIRSATNKINKQNHTLNISHSDTCHSVNHSQNATRNEPFQSTSLHNTSTNAASFLSECLQRLTQKSSATAGSDTKDGSYSKAFQSIRERLKSSVPLCPVTSSVGKGKLSQTMGIPKVTVIMSSQTESQARVSGTGLTFRTGEDGANASVSVGNISCSVGQTRLNSTTSATDNCLQTVLTASSSGSVIVAKPSATTCLSSSTHSNDSLPNRKLATCSSQPSGFTSLSSSSGLWLPASSVSNTDVSLVDNGNVSAATQGQPSQGQPTQGQPSVAINTPTVVASTSSHSTLFENIFHNSVQSAGVNSGHHSSRGHYPATLRSQPYNWQNRSRYLSLMGPYLQSRGVNPTVPDHTHCPAEDASSCENVFPNSQSTGRDSSTLQRDQASSDTENELSAHLSGSGAYFMPIPEHRLRAASSSSLRSSASLDRNTDSSGLRQYTVSAESTDSSQGQRSESVHSQRSRSGSTRNQRSRSNSQEYEVELVVDQNENYTTNRNINPDVHQQEEIVHRNYDSNNNSIHISVNNNLPSSTVSQRVDQRDPDYVRLRNSFVSMTDQIEREMNDLNRRINALRDSFNESIRSLRHDRHRYETLDGHIPAETATNLGPQDASDASGLTGTAELDPDESSQNVPISQPATLLETSLRTHAQGRRPLHPRSQLRETDPVDDSSHWRTLQRHYLHPHYSSSILDETINRPDNVIQSAINRAIAGAFMGTGESAVANNIINQTHRIQHWDFTKCDIPDITQSKVNIVVPHCKLHNSASAHISQDNTLLATFVPNHHGFPDNNILAVYSLLPETRGQCLYTKQFGPNAVSVSISPSNSYILVCLAARRLTWVFTSQQLVAHVYKLEKKKAGENSMKHVKDVHHSCSSDIRTHVSGNSACWLPVPGQGLVYGTNRGDLNICRPGVKVVTGKADTLDLDGSLDDSGGDSSFQRLFGPQRLFGQVPWGVYPSPNRVSISTQTAGVRRSAGTQTPEDT